MKSYGEVCNAKPRLVGKSGLLRNEHPCGILTKPTITQLCFVPFRRSLLGQISCKASWPNSVSPMMSKPADRTIWSCQDFWLFVLPKMMQTQVKKSDMSLIHKVRERGISLESRQHFPFSGQKPNPLISLMGTFPIDYRLLLCRREIALQKVM